MISIDRIERLPAWFGAGGHESDVVLSTRVRIARNLANHQFPGRASLLEKKSVYDEITAVIARLPRYKHFQQMNFAQIRRLEQLFLVENRAASVDLLNMEGDRGVISDRSCRISVMVNEEDHIRFQCMEPGFSAPALWERLDELDTELGRDLLYAFDETRGFLTCCPTNSGTGLRISFLMHLPGLVLTKTIDQALQGASQMGISARGFFGENSEVIGNFFQLSNQAAMGASEPEFYRSTQSIIGAILDCERAARDRILKEARLELVDKIYRAYGILLYAQTLSIEETLNLTSALRLGIQMGLFDRITLEALNKMCLLSMPAHLQLMRDKSMDNEELSVCRAEIVRKALNECSG